MSSDSSNSSRGGGVGIVGLLTVLFIGLKLGHVIDWSWWWVLSPLWISGGLAVVIIAAVLGFGLIGAALADRRSR